LLVSILLRISQTFFLEGYATKFHPQLKVKQIYSWQFSAIWPAKRWALGELFYG
jgi:hypothetical protein